MADVFSQLVELGQFLTVDTRTDVKLKALEYVQGITSHGEFALDLLQEGSVVKALVNLVINDPLQEVKSVCVRTFVNLTTNDVVASSSLLLGEAFISALATDVIDKESSMADFSAMLLANLTRIESNCDKVRVVFENGSMFRNILIAFTRDKYNTKCQLNYLGSFISNLLTLKSYRVSLLTIYKDLLIHVPPYTTYEASLERRAAAARILKNCSFESDYHDWLLGAEMELLPHLLLPLAGPEELPDDEMEKLPLDLQYLPEDKTRELDSEIRLMIVNTLHQLCTTKFGRETLRNNGVYYILREMHKSEKCDTVYDAVMHVIQILINDEPEPELENLKNFEIPPEVAKKLDEANKLDGEEKGPTES